MLTASSKIYIAGHGGMVGSAIWRQLESQGHTRLIGRRQRDLDLTCPAQVEAFFKTEKPEFVIVAAACVGGIQANRSRPYDFIFRNLQIQNHLIDAARRHQIRKLLFLGSSCIYPKLAPQPLLEEHLLTGPLEPTNQWYAIAKIAGIKLCEAAREQFGCDFISAMPTNLYGIGDNYDLEGSHVLPALIRKFHEAKLRQLSAVECWGTGFPLREFLFADDLARACITLMRSYSGQQFVNIGSGVELSIRELAERIKLAVGYEGTLRWDPSQPDGTPRKLMDSSKMRSFGWQPEVSLEEGLRIACQDYQCRYGPPNSGLSHGVPA